MDPKQELLLSEECILVDENDLPIGHASKKVCHKIVDRKPPPLHRAFSVFLFNMKGELLLQQRSTFKITFPNHFTNSCCSHPLFNDAEMVEKNAIGVKVAAIRRLNFELGIPLESIQPDDLTFVKRIYYCSPSNGEWGEHEIDYILFMQKDVSLNPNLNEVQRIQYIKKNQFDNFLVDLSTQKIPITPWFSMISNNFLKYWWEKLDNIKDILDQDNIYRF